MISTKLNYLEPEDVDKLYGLTLNIAFAYYILGWRWYRRSQDGYAWILLDEPVPEGKHLHHEIGAHIGSNHFVLKILPKFHENIDLLILQEEKIKEDGLDWKYIRHLENELKSANHFDLVHASPDKRARAMVKMYIAKFNEEKSNAEIESRPDHQSSESFEDSSTNDTRTD